MRERLDRLRYIGSTAFFGLLAVLFVGVLITSLVKNAMDIWVRVGWDWRHPGNYVGLTVGFLAYLVPLILMLLIPRFKHNLSWMLKFTHELTHTLVALLFFRKIHEFVIKDGDCYASSLPLKIGNKTITFGYVPITLSPANLNGNSMNVNIGMQYGESVIGTYPKVIVLLPILSGNELA